MLKYVRSKNDTILKDTITAEEKNQRLEEARLWIQQYKSFYDINGQPEEWSSTTPTIGEGEYASNNNVDVNSNVNVNGIVGNRATVSAEAGLEDNVQLTAAFDPRAAQAVKMKRRPSRGKTNKRHKSKR